MILDSMEFYNLVSFFSSPMKLFELYLGRLEEIRIWWEYNSDKEWFVFDINLFLEAFPPHEPNTGLSETYGLAT